MKTDDSIFFVLLWFLFLLENHLSYPPAAYNALGEIIWTTREQRIDISSLAQGVYTLRIETDNEVVMKRLVVQK